MYVDSLVDVLNQATDSAKKLESHLERGVLSLSSRDQAEIAIAAAKLNQSLQVLLPPRGPSTTHECPHCGKDIEVTVSKP